MKKLLITTISLFVFASCSGSSGSRLQSGQTVFAPVNGLPSSFFIGKVTKIENGKATIQGEDNKSQQVTVDEAIVAIPGEDATNVRVSELKPKDEVLFNEVGDDRTLQRGTVIRVDGGDLYIAGGVDSSTGRWYTQAQCEAFPKRTMNLYRPTAKIVSNWETFFKNRKL